MKAELDSLDCRKGQEASPEEEQGDASAARLSEPSTGKILLPSMILMGCSPPSVCICVSLLCAPDRHPWNRPRRGLASSWPLQAVVLLGAMPQLKAVHMGSVRKQRIKGYLGDGTGPRGQNLPGGSFSLRLTALCYPTNDPAASCFPVGSCFLG